MVVGFPWCKEPREVSLESLAAKILCVPHNNALSPLDEQAAKWYRAWRKIAELDAERTRLDPAGKKLWNPLDLTIKGDLLERWVLKTLVSITCMFNPGSRPWEPTARLVSLVFGESGWCAGEGLYLAQKVGDGLRMHDQFGCCPVVESPGLDLVAGRVNLKGIQFVLSLRENGPTNEDLSTLSVPQRLIFHPQEINNKLGRHLSARMKFVWPPRSTG